MSEYNFAEWANPLSEVSQSSTDRSTAGDPTTISTGKPGGWSWGQSNWDFDEWDVA